VNKTFSIKTLGCKLNQFESSQIVESLHNAGWRQKKFGEKASVVIVNTCTVTAKSDKKCRNYIRQGARFSSLPGVVVIGCLAEYKSKELNEMPEVALILGNQKKRSLLLEIKKKFKKDFSLKSKNLSSAKVKKKQPPQSRPFLKIQDGCAGKCSYCIIPYVRGKPRSVNYKTVLKEAEEIIASGRKEIVLTGITIGGYSDSGYDLPDLIEKLTQLRGNFRIRITSLEPNHLTDKLLDLLGHEKICHHLHLPLQAGSDRILQRMKRRYSVKEYKHVIEKIKSRYPNLALGTDLIVGFPGEEESDFQMNLDLINWAGFAYLHQFLYSPRLGTEAYSLKQTVSENEIINRSKILRSFSSKIQSAYMSRFINQTFSCVVEKKGQGFIGVSDNYLKIFFNSDDFKFDLKNKFCPVKLLEVKNNRPRGVCLD
jgi:threonylcarbamoyladenosine tRNA methylthiotransferase MtaB